MNVESERFNPAQFVPPWVRNEHLERFKFAAAMVRSRVVVDCACGTGIGTRLFAEAGAARVHAFDISDEAVHATAERCSDMNTVTVQKANATNLPLGDQVADLYISFETIEHLSDRSAFLKEVHRVLRPGGIFICSTPNRRVYSPGRTIVSKPWNHFHTCEYDTEEFSELLGDIFSELKIYGQNPVRHWRASLMEVVGRSLTGNSAVRINQILKVPRFLLERTEWRAVRPHQPDRDYEINIIVCHRSGE